MRNVTNFKRRQEAQMTRGTAIVLSWVEFPGGSQIDPTTGAELGTAVTMTETVRGFVYAAEDAKSVVRLHQVLDRGGMMIDLPAATVIEGRAQLKFTIAGQVYVQDKVGEKVMQHFDAIVEDVKLARTVLLRLET